MGICRLERSTRPKSVAREGEMAGSAVEVWNWGFGVGRKEEFESAGFTDCGWRDLEVENRAKVVGCNNRCLG
jgi:hypothetical protein